MTNLEALMAECEPYSISVRVAEKSLADCQLVKDGDYTSKTAIAKAAVIALSRFLTLRSENEGAFSQTFDTAGLQNRICSLCLIAGLNASDYIPRKSVIDGSNYW